MTRFERVFVGTFMVAGMVVVAIILASFTVVPMMSNYAECGTIFLCSAQQ